MQEDYFTKTIGTHLDTIFNEKKKISVLERLTKDSQSKIIKLTGKKKIYVSDLNTNHGIEQDVKSKEKEIDAARKKIISAKESLFNLLGDYKGVEIIVPYGGEDRSIVVDREIDEEELYDHPNDNDVYQIKYNGEYV